ncbi:MAG: type II CRISPR RNA-guided endonuclease Cas9 [Oscillospiraceae bacterium]|nr:type II CRISPR RNA-guided endonuclease Cas9 [Oscillospiraceae bacterium]
MRYGVGLDIGITSVGWAIVLLDEYGQPWRIGDLGVRIFDAPEQPKTGQSLAAPRREARSARRRLRRCKHRKQRIRSLMLHHGLLEADALNSLYDTPVGDIYELRTQALDQPVTREEFARMLIHLAQRRGFRSNRKAADGGKEDGAMLGAVTANKQRMADQNYRTVGEMLHRDELYHAAKRNKSVNYQNTVTRDMIEHEAELLFTRQRELGNAWASEELQAQYLAVLLAQRSFDEGPGEGSPYGGFQDKVGFCTFEPDQKRAAKATYSFELSRLLQDVNKLHLLDGGKVVLLTPEQRKLLIEYAHSTASISYTQVRKKLGVPEHLKFNLVNYKRDSDQAKDETARKPKWLAAYHKMEKAAGKGVLSHAQRDELGRIFSLYKTKERLLQELAGMDDFDPKLAEQLAENLDSFSGFGNLSLVALRKVNEQLLAGHKYNEACEKAGYDFQAKNKDEKQPYISLKHLAEQTEHTITSPVGRRALSQSAKVLNAIIRHMGEGPSYIKVELARELAKPFDERRKMTKGMEENQAQNERIMEDIRQTDGISPRGQDLVKLKLYKQQGELCLYSGEQLDRRRLFEPGYVDVDHIIPYSLCFDDSYNNKALVRTRENQQKGNRLPLQYLTGAAADKFRVLVNASNLSTRKKQNLLKEEFTQADEEAFKERNLQDTKTISRFFYNYLIDFLDFAPSTTERKKQVYAVSGAVTSLMRKRWGLTKVREEGDLHHALDAAVVACVTDGMIRKIKNYTEQQENREVAAYVHQDGQSYTVSRKTGELKARFPQPWQNFSDELQARLNDNPQRALERLGTYTDGELAQVRPVFVSRMPRRKVTGAAHKETIKSRPVPTSKREVVLKKVALTELKLGKDKEIADYYNPKSDVRLYDALKTQLNAHGGDAKKAFAEPFRKPKSDGTPGPIVKKVKLMEPFTVNTEVHKGAGRADNGTMLRADVFHVEGEGYYLVPIYVADTIKPRLPNRAVVQGKPHDEWKKMKDDDFIFSIYPNDLLRIEGKKAIEMSRVRKESKRLVDKIAQQEAYVYYKGTNLSKGSIQVITHDNTYQVQGLGVKTLVSLEKYTIDMLGNYTRVGREKRLDFKKPRKHKK